MTALLLATLLNLSPGIQLADNVEARHLALSDARLPLLFVSDDEERPSIDAMTREQLAVELRRLDDTRPSLVGPIVLLGVGAALAIPGAVLVITGLPYLAFRAEALVGALFIFGGGILLTVGVVLALIGGIKLAVRVGARSRHAEETDEVRKRIDTMDQTVPPPPPGPAPDAMPPPPPPPPSANLVVPGGMQTVMTF